MVPRAIRHVSREASLAGNRFPVYVRREIHTVATARIHHDAVKLMFVTGASTTLTHESGTTTVPNGGVVLLPARQWFSGSPAGTLETTTAYIDEDFFREHARWLEKEDNVLGALALQDSAPVKINLPAPLRYRSRTVMESMLDTQRTFAPVSAHLLHAVSLITVLASHRYREAGDHPALQQALTLIDTHLDVPWTVDRLAEACAISGSQLSRLFQRHLGTSPARFLREQRAHRLAELLSDDTQSVESAARRVGWHDPAHASRAFRQVYGVSPQTYRTYRGQNRLSR